MQTPDLIIANGRLMTFDPARPMAEALAIADGRIMAVGTTDAIRMLAGRGTRIVDAGQATVLPGIIDSHVHLFGGSAELDYLDLFGVTGFDAVTAKVRAYAETCPAGEVVFAIMAEYAIFGAGHQTTRHDLDRVLPDRPFAIFAPDHHTMWANTKALEMGGVLQGGAVEKGSEIVMGADGLAAGELRESGAFGPVLRCTRYGGRELMGMVTGADPEGAGPAERAMDRGVLARGLKHCARQGITGLHNMDGNFYTAELLQDLDADGRLLCRTEIPFHYKNFDPLDRFEEAAEMRRRFTGDRVWCNRVKFFMDGVVESGTALMLRPYPNSESIGDAIFETDHFNAAIARADAAGFQIAVHAIGDRAVRQTLDAYEAAQAANGVRDSRHRIEHVETLHPDDLPRFAELGVVASIQPGHAPRGGYFPPHGLDERLHADQIPLAFAWQDIRESGARVCFSTDWPVIPVDVMRTIKAAVAPLAMPAPWKDQRQSLFDTLKSYTADNAWVGFQEDRLGQLKPGMLADVVMLSHDLEALDPEEITKASAQLTLCGGQVTWEA